MHNTQSSYSEVYEYNKKKINSILYRINELPDFSYDDDDISGAVTLVTYGPSWGGIEVASLWSIKKDQGVCTLRLRTPAIPLSNELELTDTLFDGDVQSYYSIARFLNLDF